MRLSLTLQVNGGNGMDDLCELDRQPGLTVWQHGRRLKGGNGRG